MPQAKMPSDIFGADRSSAATARRATDVAETARGAYVRSHGASEIRADVERLVKGNPGKSVLAAAAVGFLLARTLNRRD